VHPVLRLRVNVGRYAHQSYTKTALSIVVDKLFRVRLSHEPTPKRVYLVGGVWLALDNVVESNQPTWAHKLTIVVIVLTYSGLGVISVDK
jgi:uncharacterized membrane protein